MKNKTDKNDNYQKKNKNNENNDISTHLMITVD